ncbi:uncharacterized protein SCODWIG_02150 [Saccharomycodes ludwigii]|uniref:PXA domain-containing protein n=1 Tax=Saccharomycodes ludwigii TaxID=36035 RepID=A0A376B730_9ASCO|nr:hypothetical protein SCDLUD_001851 [Saccharomycodes ludwigii]KAH3902040.1 hypothetical protein SCDLUD_001851 [Saccharomycodes ludwigii]SSD60389.1 uncharacterized protein SCODWIG_02150 [Saccharomycodes ludwigii]
MNTTTHNIIYNTRASNWYNKRKYINNSALFSSKYSKDSPKYLVSLIKSINPSLDIGDDITDKTKLAYYALVSLFVKNYISSWYETKINSNNTDFIQSLYIEFFEPLYNYIHDRSCRVDWIKIFLDDIPFIMETQHNNYDLKMVDYYLRKNVESSLEQTFLHSLFKDFILTKLLKTILEPNVIFPVLNKLLASLTLLEYRPKLDKQRPNVFQKIWKSIAFVFNSIKENDTTITTPDKGSVHSILQRHIFVSLIKILNLTEKKPLVYGFYKWIQQIIITYTNIDQILYASVKQEVLEKVSIYDWLIQLRHILFPHDDIILKPGNIIYDMDKLKSTCKDNLCLIIDKYHLTTLLGINKQDDLNKIVDEFIADPENLQGHIYIILDCIAASFEENCTPGVV